MIEEDDDDIVEEARPPVKKCKSNAVNALSKKKKISKEKIAEKTRG